MVNDGGKRNPEFLIFRSSVNVPSPGGRRNGPGAVKMLLLNRLSVRLSVCAQHAQRGGPGSSERAGPELVGICTLRPQPPAHIQCLVNMCGTELGAPPAVPDIPQAGRALLSIFPLSWLLSIHLSFSSLA